MKITTVRALNQLDQNFYRQVAQSFSETRQFAWPGWSRVLIDFKQSISRSKQQDTTITPLTIVDIAAGNGRFYQFLIDKLPKMKFNYLAIDANTQLLTIAQKHSRLKFKQSINPNPTDIQPQLVFQPLDLVELLIKNKSFGFTDAQLIVVFGLMHHLPSFDLRQQLLNQLTRKLAPGGLLVVSFWQFFKSKRLRKKIIDPQQISGRHLPIKSDELEKNDYILGWQGNKSVYRYCHHFSNKEINRLSQSLTLKVVDNFYADGQENNLNRYLVWQKQ